MCKRLLLETGRNLTPEFVNSANKQKANIKSQSAGADLLSRLNPSPGDHSKNNKKKNKNTKASNGNAKVNRAKGKAA